MKIMLLPGSRRDSGSPASSESKYKHHKIIRLLRSPFPGDKWLPACLNQSIVNEELNAGDAYVGREREKGPREKRREGYMAHAEK